MDRQKFLMDESEKDEMIAALKKKWEVVHKEYQTLTHKNKLDTLAVSYTHLTLPTNREV